MLMFVAGGLIWANTRSKRFFWDDAMIIRFGWPEAAVQQEILLDGSTPIYIKDYESLFIDLMTAFIILTAVWFLCEWLIRWRAARKGA
ncbi:MAG TPA: hypothetical protein VKX17_17135 [Planctomycetota bacterium]|nr:hypothetical protein [Planctomycetota bacterium]